MLFRSGANAELSQVISRLVDEISEASQEQANGISQVSKAVAEMDRVTQATAANAEESACAAEEMSAQAEEMTASAQSLSEMAQRLQGLVAQFRIPTGGRHTGDEDVRTPRATTASSAPRQRPAQQPTAKAARALEPVISGHGNGRH